MSSGSAFRNEAELLTNERCKSLAFVKTFLHLRHQSRIFLRERLGIFLDVFNIFLFFLQIFGRR